ncbi:MAG: RluA family pseudouridine synthase [Myxococcales bacterium]|nr:RluA family pseudouridine synthase [Myxococcales bacterium]
MADTVRFVIPADVDGARLDQALARGVPGLSRRRARVLIDLGGVFVDRARCKQAGRIVRTGQTVEANLGGAFERAVGAAPAGPELALPIVYEDDDLIVVDKPAGMVTAPTPESDRGDALDRLRRRPGAGEVFLVHRIDRPTSGLLVFAKTATANRVLGQRFVDHDLTRRYLAFVAGAVGDAVGTIDQPIAGQRAITHVRAREVLAGGRATRLTLELETGRSHQIRLHLAALGHPVLGDTQHGGDVARQFRPRPPRLALHATHLGLRHPITDAPLAWDSPLPDDLATWCQRLAAEPTP